MRFALLAALCGLVLAQPVHAASFTFDLTATSSNFSQEFSTPATLASGDTVTVNFRAPDGMSFVNEALDSTWGLLLFNEGATRIADYSGAFYNDGNLVFTTPPTSDVATGSNHLGAPITPGFTGDFDLFTWTAIIDSSTSPINTAHGMWLITGASLVGSPVSAVPLPGAAMLFGSALVGMFGIKRRRSGRPVF